MKWRFYDFSTSLPFSKTLSIIFSKKPNMSAICLFQYVTVEPDKKPDPSILNNTVFYFENLIEFTVTMATNSIKSPEKALDKILEILRNFLPGPLPSLPDNNISILSLAEKALSVGNWRGMEKLGSFAAVTLKGGRLEAVIRFQLWGNGLSAVDGAIAELQKSLLTDKDNLWLNGFLQIRQVETSLAEHISILNAWRKTTDYKVLYEYQYKDTDGAESIIVRIPIYGDLERSFYQREETVVTDEIVRWDKEGAPALEVVGNSQSARQTSGIASLLFLPAGFTSNQIVLSRLQLNAEGPPTNYLTLSDFLDALNDESNPERHGQVIFTDFAEFALVFDSAGDPIELGDWDEDGHPDLYQYGALAFEPPIKLETGNDIFQLSYINPTLTGNLVAYFRAEVYTL